MITDFFQFHTFSIKETRWWTLAHANARGYSSKFSLDISIHVSPSARSTKTLVLLVLTLLLVLYASSLPRACVNACAVDAPITVISMLNCANVIVKTGFNVHCFSPKLDFFSWCEENKFIIVI